MSFFIVFAAKIHNSFDVENLDNSKMFPHGKGYRVMSWNLHVTYLNVSMAIWIDLLKKFHKLNIWI